MPRFQSLKSDSLLAITMVAPQCLSLLLRPILGRRHAGAVFELFGEAAGIDEAGFAGDLGGGEAGFVEETHGGEDSGLDEELLWADAEGGLEAALQVAERQAAGFRDGFEGDVFGIVAADGVQPCATAAAGGCAVAAAQCRGAVPAASTVDLQGTLRSKAPASTRTRWAVSPRR